MNKKYKIHLFAYYNNLKPKNALIYVFTIN